MGQLRLREETWLANQQRSQTVPEPMLSYWDLLPSSYKGTSTPCLRKKAKHYGDSSLRGSQSGLDVMTTKYAEDWEIMLSASMALQPFYAPVASSVSPAYPVRWWVFMRIWRCQVKPKTKESTNSPSFNEKLSSAVPSAQPTSGLLAKENVEIGAGTWVTLCRREHWRRILLMGGTGSCAWPRQSGSETPAQVTLPGMSVSVFVLSHSILLE